MPLNLASLMPAFRHFQLIYVALRLGLPGLLAAGPKTLEELAQAAGVPAARLERLLHGLLWAEVIERGPEGLRLTAEAAPLCDLSSDSLAEGILFTGHFFYSAWGHLNDYLTLGANPFEKAHGCSFFDHLSGNPDLAAFFHRVLAAHTRQDSAAIAALPVLTSCHTLVDVGGGEGNLVLDILNTHPKMQGVIFDLPVARAGAERLIGEHSLTDRCRFITGDMFREVPRGGSAYIVNWLLHKWSDEKVVAILRSVRSSMSAEAHLIVIERLMPEVVEHNIGMVPADLNALCLNAGAERTQSAFAVLLEQGGFKLNNVVQLGRPERFHALVCSPREASGHAEIRALPDVEPPGDG